MAYLKNPIVLYIVIGVLFLSNVGTIVYFGFNKEECPVCNEEITIAEIDEPLEAEEEEKKYIYVDIKGYVKKPGVYELEEGAIVNDAIKLAGGIKNTGTTENINLSKKLVDEDMIVVSSKSELKKANSCSTTTSVSTTTTNDSTLKQSTTNQQSDAKISINTASKEELMTLSGVGEKTAEKIIEYRSTQKFETIEDLKNVSGIGDSIFEKIKDLITV